MIGGVPDMVQDQVSLILAKTGGAPATLFDFSFLAGGCINSGGRLKTSHGDFFIKWNDALRFPRMFETEAAGLNKLRDASGLRIPRVVGAFEQDRYQGIVLEFVESRQRSSTYWQDLGYGLAALHRHSQPQFGLDYDNYIGSLPQHNALTVSWSQFFADQRLTPQLRMAVDSGRLGGEAMRQFDALYKKLEGFFPDEKPALLHGDLWTGNVVVDDAGTPCLIDPAVYYGHREAELAFTHLFGGFEEAFYSAYAERFPLTPGFLERMDVYNLYPLLVHVNLFGGSYAAQVRSILESIV